MDTNGSALTPRSVDESVRPSTAPAAIKIDDDVPMPPRGGGCGRPASGMTAILRSLEVGQSFVFPMIQNSMKRTSQRAGQLARQGRMGKYAVRIVVENGKRVVRIWRVA